MNQFIWILIFLLLTSSSAFGHEESFNYEDKGRRDPFLSLVDKNGNYLLETELLYSSSELQLSGILWDPQGKSSALINNQVVKVGESIFGFVIKDIRKESVIVLKDDQEFILKVSVEGKEQ